MRALSISLILLASFVSSAQSVPTPVLIDSAIAHTHLTQHRLAQISPTAKSIGTFGDYTVQIFIDTAGKVTSATALSGPQSLQFDALRYARTLTYTPFTKDGQPVTATTVVTIPFGPNSPNYTDPQPWPQELQDAQTDCLDLKMKKAAPAEIAKKCTEVADDLYKLPMNDDYVNRRITYLDAATDLLLNKQPKEALVQADRAIALVEEGHDDAEGSAWAYLVRAEVEAALNQLPTAHLDLTKAETFQRAAMEIVQSDTLKTKYSATLKSILTYHAKILKATGNTAAAQAKMDEAAKL
jgi:hypothetical protein